MTQWHYDPDKRPPEENSVVCGADSPNVCKDPRTVAKTDDVSKVTCKRCRAKMRLSWWEVSASYELYIVAARSADEALNLVVAMFDPLDEEMAALIKSRFKAEALTMPQVPTVVTSYSG